MLVIPAIDLKQGKVVRLEQGLMDRDKEYSDDPAAVARRWESLGARLIHVVDLDGAFAGKPVNREAVLAIAAAVEVPIELGGGLRDLATIRDYLDHGVGRAILGTAAHRDPGLVRAAAAEFPGRVVVGIDAKDGMVMVRGWADGAGVAAIELARRYQGMAVAAIIYTDIRKDGMLTGPSIESTVELARAVKLPVIASGGVANLDHVRALLPFERDGVIGVITGRAVYEGTLDLAAAIRIAEGGGA